MKGIAITHKGLEDIAALEIKEIIKASSEIKETSVIFNLKKIEELCTLAYKAQSLIRVIYLFDSFKVKDDEKSILDKIKKSVEKIDLTEWLDEEKTFRVSCKHVENEISSQEIEKETGAIIIDKIQQTSKYQQKVDLDNPDIIFYIYIYKNQCYLGIDFCGFDLSKRDYKVFSNPADTKGTISYSVLRIAGYKKSDTLLDPFCSSGTIPIEAALFKMGSVNFYRKDRFAFLKLRQFENHDFKKLFNHDFNEEKPKILASDERLFNMRAAKKNAKIASVNKMIEFSKIDVDWLDTKYEKQNIDLIATKPIFLKYELDKTKKLYDGFFYGAKYILKDKGKIAIISRGDDLIFELSKKHGFNICHERIVFQGDQQLKITIFQR
ncbi:MAG: THUMP domain-containing protein [Candidatus Nanoarchaeia archaeon]|nr:THUMP domain-containing protein [Candidatus Nanoarchaeia archaeon]